MSGARLVTGVNYRASITGNVREVATAALTVAFAITAVDGAVLAGIPLMVRIDDFLEPIAVTIEDRVADTDHAAMYRPVDFWKSQCARASRIGAHGG